MSVESRMSEFDKVSDKNQMGKNVPKRMSEFDKVEKEHKDLADEKPSLLPYGIKEHRPCPYCAEIMNIHEVKKDRVIYKCPACKKQTEIELN